MLVQFMITASMPVPIRAPLTHDCTTQKESDKQAKHKEKGFLRLIRDIRASRPFKKGNKWSTEYCLRFDTFIVKKKAYFEYIDDCNNFPEEELHSIQKASQVKGSDDVNVQVSCLLLLCLSSG